MLAGRAALRAKGGLAPLASRRPRTDAADSADAGTLPLQVGAPTGWAEDAIAVIKKLWRGPGSEPPTPPDVPVDGGTTSTEGTLTGATGEKYTFALDTDLPVMKWCPVVRGNVGVVKLIGIMNGTRTLTIPGSPHTIQEHFFAGFRVTGYVDQNAKLVSYDISVSIKGTDAGGATFEVGAQAPNITPASSGQRTTQIPPGTIEVTEGRPGDTRFAAAALEFAQAEGLKYVQDAETYFNSAQGCVRVESHARFEKNGFAKFPLSYRVETFSKITGKRISSHLSMQPVGGAQVTPTKAETTPSKAAIVNVKMPQTPSGRAHDVLATAAARPSITVTALSPNGRATTTIDSDTGVWPLTISIVIRSPQDAPRGAGTISERWRILPDCGRDVDFDPGSCLYGLVSAQESYYPWGDSKLDTGDCTYPAFDTSTVPGGDFGFIDLRVDDHIRGFVGDGRGEHLPTWKWVPTSCDPHSVPDPRYVDYPVGIGLGGSSSPWPLSPEHPSNAGVDPGPGGVSWSYSADYGGQ